MGPSQMYKAAEVYILTKIYDVAEATPRIKIDPSTNQLYISVASRERRFIVDITNGEEIVDTYQNIKLTWRFVHIPPPDKESPEIRYFKLIIKKKFKDMVFGYLKHILDEADAINERQKVLKLYNPRSKEGVYQGPWVCVPLEHPATFETLAMDPDLKQHIIEDLNLFKSRKEFYNRVGRAWKRGYLLNGPPGTGKSSLIAAMANHLKFDIYDLQLTDIHNDNELRSILLKTNNRSIVFTLSGLLNFIDGLWSSCGDERIIVFTTNDMEKLDKALLRPGRMDKVINMSYCTKDGFQLLARNYLEIEDGDSYELYGEIEDIIESKKATPAEVAEKLMTKEIEEVDDNLQALFEFLKSKKDESEEN
uniref:AAA+ ATPase domain-containing protein n=1 Tax=Fagus sylvatica TaxID=28930 RepID=A0A2N9ESS2_FAGSY